MDVCVSNMFTCIMIRGREIMAGDEGGKKFSTHLHLPPLFPAVYVYIITLPFFCKIIFSLMRTQDWVKTSELPDNNICPTIWLVDFPHGS